MSAPRDFGSKGERAQRLAQPAVGARGKGEVLGEVAMEGNIFTQHRLAGQPAGPWESSGLSPASNGDAWDRAQGRR